MGAERKSSGAWRRGAARLSCGVLLLLLLAAGQSAQTTARRAGRADAARAAGAGTYVNPVLDADFPDPTVIRASDGWFYAYATQTVSGGLGYNFQVARSRDLVSW